MSCRVCNLAVTLASLGSRTKGVLTGKETTEGTRQSVRRKVLGAEVGGCHGDERMK